MSRKTIIKKPKKANWDYNLKKIHTDRHRHHQTTSGAYIENAIPTSD